MNWLCWHVGASSDPKLKLVAKRTGASLSQVVHAWVHHLERGAEGEPRGTFGTIDPEEAELATEIPAPIWMAITIAFEERGLTNEGIIVNFDKRNHAKSTFRVRAFRERQKLLGNGETLHGVSGNPETFLEHTGQDRTGHTDKHLNTTTVPVAARETNGSSNGHVHGNGNGKSIDLNSIGGASRPSPRNGAYTPEQREEKWFLNCQDWMRDNWRPDRTAQAVADFLEGNRDLINIASDERAAAVASGRLREKLSPSPKRKAPQI